jgi:hypothetical protein
MNIVPMKVAHAARARVQHEPDEARFVQAHLDEVVARAQRPQMLDVVGLRELRVVTAQLGELRLELSPRRVHRAGRLLPRTGVAAAGLAAVRHRALDGRAQRAQVVGQVLGRQRGLAGDHAAADVHAHRGRDDGAQRRDHRAHGGADAEVHVGHGRDVLEDDGQARGVGKLAFGLVLDGNAAGPHLQRHTAGHVFVDVVGFHD